jgi:hypothetical protein
MSGETSLYTYNEFFKEYILETGEKANFLLDLESSQSIKRKEER